MKASVKSNLQVFEIPKGSLFLVPQTKTSPSFNIWVAVTDVAPLLLPNVISNTTSLLCQLIIYGTSGFGWMGHFISGFMLGAFVP